MSRPRGPAGTGAVGSWLARAGVLAALALVALGLASLGTGRPADRVSAPSLLLVTLDTVRADHCSAYGYPRPTTPTLARVAAAGVLFEEAYGPMATTTPAHATLFTGLLPRSHGLLRNGSALAAARVTLAEILAGAGYQTAAVVSSFVLDRRFRLDQGFADYDDRMSASAADAWSGAPDGDPGGFDQDAQVTTDQAVAWLRDRRDPARPFFLWVHYFDPHDPYVPPPPYDALFEAAGPDPLAGEVARYDAEIRETDDAVGRLLAALDDAGLATATLVVVTADHGEGLMQHGWMHHGLHLYEEAVRVPLILRWPGRVPAGRRIAGAVQLADVLPTILDLLRVRPPGGAPAPEGRTLAPVVAGPERLDPARPLFLQRREYGTGTLGGFTVAGEKLAVRAGPWKYIEAPDEGTVELYDLARDPGETTNLQARFPAEAARLARLLADWKRTTPPAPEGAVADVDAARLRALGYVP